MANKPGGTLYIGVSSSMLKRDYEHKHGLIDGFTKQYDCSTLVYLEYHDTIEAAILREKQMKKWNRAWKIRLINQHNPQWHNINIT